MRLFIVGCLCLGALFGCSDSDRQVRFADGSHTQRSHWDGRWLVINYWAEWCAPCREEIPELNELHKQRASHGLVVLGVNWDGLVGEPLDAVIERMNVEFPTLLDDPHQRYGYPRAQQLPVTVVINPDREVEKILVGPQTGESILLHVTR